MTHQPQPTQGSPIFLADPDPWPDSVDGAWLLDAIAAAIQRYVVLTLEVLIAVALWVLHTHAIGAAAISPVLGITSPVKRCAKTLLLTLLAQLVRRPLPLSNITAAALFRTIEGFTPTLLIDEADTFLRDSEALRGVLNSGHFRSMAFVVRTVGDHHEPRTFSTWGPKVIALIGKIPGTLEDRALVLPMRRRTPDEPLTRLRLDRLHQELEPLRRQAARWAMDHLDALQMADPEVPGELHDRAADNWRPLLAIADLAGGPWPSRAREAARRLTAGIEEGDQADVILLLQDLRELFDQAGVDRLTTAGILDHLHRLEDRPWGEWMRGRPLTARGLAKLLMPFGARPRTVRLGGSTVKGYLRVDLEDSFARYPCNPSHPSQVNENAELAGSNHPSHDDSVTEEEEPLTIEEISDVTGVTDGEPGEEAG